MSSAMNLWDRAVFRRRLLAAGVSAFLVAGVNFASCPGALAEAMATVREEAPASGLPSAVVAEPEFTAPDSSQERTITDATEQRAENLAGDVAPPGPLGDSVVALDDDSLDQVRGGFEVPGSGLQFSFGIERAVYINGQLITTTVLTPLDQQAMSGGTRVEMLANGTLSVIQNGPGNGTSAQIGRDMSATIIQNSLNDQRIQNVTTINAAINSMQVLRALNLQSSVRDGIVGSLQR
jgi:hypothetical protein